MIRDVFTAGLNRLASDGSGESQTAREDGCIDNQQPPKEKRKPGRVYQNDCHEGRQYWRNFDLLPDGTRVNISHGQFRLDDNSPHVQDLKKRIFE